MEQDFELHLNGICKRKRSRKHRNSLKHGLALLISVSLMAGTCMNAMAFDQEPPEVYEEDDESLWSENEQEEYVQQEDTSDQDAEYDDSQLEDYEEIVISEDTDDMLDSEALDDPEDTLDSEVWEKGR